MFLFVYLVATFFLKCALKRGFLVLGLPKKQLHSSQALCF